MGKLAFVFPGQGSQYIGMGQELSQTPSGDKVFAVARETLGEEFLKLIRRGPKEEFQLTANTQPAILLVSIVAWQQLADAGIQPDYLAGHSLGEYAAHVAAGNMSLEEGLRLVRIRGELMQQAAPEGSGTMAAILGLSNEKIDEVCQKAGEVGMVAPANYNCPGQTVISGETKAIERAIELAKEMGAKRALSIGVNGPFHTCLMKPAGEGLSKVLRQVHWQKPKIPVIANVDAKEVLDIDRLIQTLIAQVSGTVQWEQTVRYLAEQGVDTFVECGPGKVLTGLIKRIAPGSTLLNIEDLASLEKSLAYLKESR